jgi:hypothetical protein
MDSKQKEALLLQQGGDLTNTDGVFYYQPPQPPRPEPISITKEDIQGLINEESQGVIGNNNTIARAREQIAKTEADTVARNTRVAILTSYLTNLNRP